MKSYRFLDKDIDRKWFVVDATGKHCGRLAVEIAKILRAKNKPYFAPDQDLGDFVIVVNVDKLHYTGNKIDQKKYYTHSGWVGGQKIRTLKKLVVDNPTFPLISAVRGMLPKNILRRRMMKRLKLFAGPDHPHQAQQPEAIELKGR